MKDLREYMPNITPGQVVMLANVGNRASVRFTRNNYQIGLFYSSKIYPVNNVIRVLNAELADFGYKLITRKELPNDISINYSIPIVPSMLEGKVFVNDVQNRYIYSSIPARRTFGWVGYFSWAECSDATVIRQQPLRIFSVTNKKKRTAFAEWYDMAAKQIMLVNKLKGNEARPTVTANSDTVIQVYEAGEPVFALFDLCSVDSDEKLLLPVLNDIPYAAFVAYENYITY